MKKLVLSMFLLIGFLSGFAQHESLFNLWYGVKWNVNATAPEVIRIAELDSMNIHRYDVLPVHNLMKGCLLLDNGVVNYYLNPADWSLKATGGASNRTGTDGQVMIEIPSHYELFEQIGDTCYAKISLVYKAGFRYVPKLYVSAYKATLNRTTLKLSSVKNTTTTYRGGNNQSAWDALDKTMLGKPVTNVNRTNFRIYAQKRGVNWSIYSYRAWKTVFWLYTIEYATRNSQAAVDYTYTVEGYHKGGLGAGVTNLASAEWNTYNGYYPIIPCGTSDSLANSTGQKFYQIPGYTGTNSVFIARYRGIENPFGDIWEWLDGVSIYHSVSPLASYAYVSENPNYYADGATNLSRARALQRLSTSSGYVKYICFGSSGDPIPATIGAGTTKYWCDYFYTSQPVATSAWYAPIVGGTAYYGAGAGFGCVYSDLGASNAGTDFGSRLVFLGS